MTVENVADEATEVAGEQKADEEPAKKTGEKKSEKK